METGDEKANTLGSPIRVNKMGRKWRGYDDEGSVEAEEIDDVSIDLSSSDEKSNNGGEDVDNRDMQDLKVWDDVLSRRELLR